MAIIRSATVEDAAGIARVHIDAWLTTYRGLMPDAVLGSLSLQKQRDMWDASLRQPKRTRTVVAAVDGQVVGFASFGPEPGNDFRYQGELYAVYILQEHQRQGIGRQLMRSAAQGLQALHFPNMMLWVLSTNQPALAFYEKLGGMYLRDRSVEFHGTLMRESAYGWPQLKRLLEVCGDIEATTDKSDKHR